MPNRRRYRRRRGRLNTEQSDEDNLPPPYSVNDPYPEFTATLSQEHTPRSLLADRSPTPGPVLHLALGHSGALCRDKIATTRGTLSIDLLFLIDTTTCARPGYFGLINDQIKVIMNETFPVEARTRIAVASLAIKTMESGTTSTSLTSRTLNRLLMNLFLVWSPLEVYYVVLISQAV